MRRTRIWISICFPGFPRKNFGQNVSKAFGIGLTASYRLQASPIIVGAEFAFLFYEIDFDPALFEEEIGHTGSQVFPGHLFLRLQPRKGVVRPYIDGLIGFQILNSQTQFPDEFEEGITHNDDAPSSRGFAAGVMIHLKNGVNERKKSIKSCSISGCADCLAAGKIPDQPARTER